MNYGTIVSTRGPITAKAATVVASDTVYRLTKTSPDDGGIDLTALLRCHHHEGYGLRWLLDSASPVPLTDAGYGTP